MSNVSESSEVNDEMGAAIGAGIILILFCLPLAWFVHWYFIIGVPFGILYAAAAWRHYQ